MKEIKELIDLLEWIPKFYYKYESDNTVTIKGMETYADEAAANADNYAMHRMFYDGDVEQNEYIRNECMRYARGYKTCNKNK